MKINSVSIIWIFLSTAWLSYGMDVYSNETSTTNLTCPLKVNTIDLYFWDGPFNGSTKYAILTEINHNLPFKDRLSASVDSSFNYFLHITNTEETDGGVYKCTVKAITGLINLIITAPPTSEPIIYMTPSVPIIAGVTVNVTCAVTGGKPLATITWECVGSFNEHITKPDNKVLSSIQLNISKNDNGKVCRCKAYHSLWSIEKTAETTLDVLYKPDTDPTIMQIPTGPIFAGSNVTLTCTASGGNPLASLSWNCLGTFTNTTSLNTTSYSVQLTVDKSYDYRNCTCFGTHPVTSYRPTVQHRLVVFYSPDKAPVIQQTPTGPIISGNKVTLTCTVSGGNPLATLFWDCTGTTSHNTSGNTASYSVEFTVDKTSNSRNCTCSAIHPVTSYRPIVQHVLIVYYSPDAGTPMIHQTPTGPISSGNKITLACALVGGNPLATLSWNCTGTTTNETSGNTALYSVEITVDKTYNNRICTCSAIHPVPSYRPTAHHRLVVYYAPDTNLTIEQTPSGAIISGNKVTITCTVSGGNPLATLSWNCFGTATNNTSGNTASYSVELIVDQTYNGRNCTCSAIHPITSYHPTVQHGLVVYYVPETALKVEQTPLGPIISGNKVTLKCSVSGGNPLAMLLWDCNNNTTNTTSGNTASYTIELIVDKTYNGRICTCSALHPITSYRPTVQHGLIVYFPPQIISLQPFPVLPWFETNDTKVTCEFEEGNPKAQLQWRKNGSVLNSTSNLIEFRSLVKEDDGMIIQCKVFNAYTLEGLEKSDEKLTLIVEYMPTAISVANMTSIEGDNVSLICTAYGNPPPTSQWTSDFPTKMEQKQNSSVLQLTNIHRNLSGIYKCMAISHSTTFGILQNISETYLNIHFAPDVTIKRQTFPIQEGMNLTLFCVAQGNPPKYRYHAWKQIIGNTVVRSFHSSNQLQLINVSYTDIGNYTCSVDNNVPDPQKNLIQSAATFVEVYFRPIFLDYDNIISAKENGNLTVCVKLLCFPSISKPVIWQNDSDQSVLENGTNIFITFEKKPLTTTFYGFNVSVDSFAYVSTLHFSSFQRNYAGFYTLQTANSLSGSNLTIQIVVSDKPQSLRNFAVNSVTSTMVTLSWTAGFNGGNSQTFTVKYKKMNTNGDILIHISESTYSNEYDIDIKNLIPSTTYVFTIMSSNIEGDTIPENNTLIIQTYGREEVVEQSIVGLVAGCLGGIFAATFLVIFMIISIRRCKGYYYKKDKTRRRLTASQIDDEADELHDNILYESADSAFGRKPQISDVQYSVVNKDKDLFKVNADSKVQETAIYSESHKKKQNAHKGDVCAQVSKKRKTLNAKNQQCKQEDVYENMNDKIGNCDSVKQIEKRNKDGLIYADLDLKPAFHTKFIHGFENRTNYVDIDFTKKADPLPSDDSDDGGQENINQEMADQ